MLYSAHTFAQADKLEISSLVKDEYHFNKKISFKMTEMAAGVEKYTFYNYFLNTSTSIYACETIYMNDRESSFELYDSTNRLKIDLVRYRKVETNTIKCIDSMTGYVSVYDTMFGRKDDSDEILEICNSVDDTKRIVGYDAHAYECYDEPTGLGVQLWVIPELAYLSKLGIIEVDGMYLLTSVSTGLIADRYYNADGKPFYNIEIEAVDMNADEVISTKEYNLKYRKVEWVPVELDD